MIHANAFQIYVGHLLISALFMVFKKLLGGEKLGQKSEECYFLKKWDSHSGHWGWTPKVKQSKDKLDYKIIPELKSWATDSIFTYLIDENRNLSDCYIIKIVKNTAGCE